MAQLAAVAIKAAPYISMASTAFSFVGGMQDAAAQEAYGKQQQAIYEMQARNAKVVAERNAKIIEDKAVYDAARLREQAGQEQATAQREALTERQRRNLALSRARAIGASSTGDTLDPTALNITGDLYAQGELNALNALYSGESAASALNSQAELTRYTGDQNAEMTRYGGATESNLLNYSGGSAAYLGAAKGSAIRNNAIGTAFSQGFDSDLLNKYASKKQNTGKNSYNMVSPYG